MSLVIRLRRSFKCGGKGIGGFTSIPDGGEPVSYGQALPIAIALQLLLVRINHPTNCFIDAHDSVAAINCLNSSIVNGGFRL